MLMCGSSFGPETALIRLLTIRQVDKDPRYAKLTVMSCSMSMDFIKTNLKLQ
jgi:hypothetical protein